MKFMMENCYDNRQNGIPAVPKSNLVNRRLQYRQYLDVVVESFRQIVRLFYNRHF